MLQFSGVRSNFLVILNAVPISCSVLIFRFEPAFVCLWFIALFV